VDPAYDTPEVLNTYAHQVGADPAIWKFLTGPKAQIENAITKGFLQPLSEGQNDEPIHSARFVVVDREGHIRSFPDGNDPEVVQRLLLDLGDLLRESPKKSP
jgi:protein SCO1/2